MASVSSLYSLPTRSNSFLNPSDSIGFSRCWQQYGSWFGGGATGYSKSSHSKKKKGAGCMTKYDSAIRIPFYGGAEHKFLYRSFTGPRHSLTREVSAYAVPKGSSKSSESEETVPSWANPDSDEPPPWAQDDGKQSAAEQIFVIPFYVYLLGSALTAIAAIGSAFEYLNKNPVFGILESDSVLYAPVLGFFFFTGFPTAGFLWYKSVQAANKEAEEQDKRDGFL